MKRWIGSGVLIFVAAVVFLRAFRPRLASYTGLDPSWQLGLTEAHLRSLVFGKDIVFTFGPFGFLQDGLATPDSYGLLLAASIGVALICAALVVCCLSEPIPMVSKIAFTLAMLIALSMRAFTVFLFLTIVVVWSLPVFRSKRVPPFAALALGVYSGILALTKFNLALTAGLGGASLLALSAVIAWREDRKEIQIASPLIFGAGFLSAYGILFATNDYGYALAAFLVAAVLLSTVFGIYVRPQNRDAFATISFILSLVLALAPSCRLFTLRAIEIASGYSAAMSIEGIAWQLPLAFSCAAILALLVIGNIRQVTAPLAVALTVAAFVGFKEGFVRQDGHVIFFFWLAFVIAAVVARMAVGRRQIVTNLVCLGLILAMLDVVYQSEGQRPLTAFALAPSTVSDDASTFASSWLPPALLGTEFAGGMAPDVLARPVRAEVGPRDVEVLPWESDVVFANGFSWNPDPVFQSYSAYTSQLDELNASHLRENGAAEIFYQWGDIDGRYGLWDEPNATKALLCRYHVNERVSEPISTADGKPMLLLSRTSERCGPVTAEPARTADWGENVPIPSSSSLTFARISVKYSALGQILRTLYRLPAVRLTLHDSDGTVAGSYRILTETSAGGVLVNPFPQNLADFESALRNRDGAKPNRSLTLDCDARYLFEPQIEVQFEHLPYR